MQEHQLVERVSSAELEKRLEVLASQINGDYAGQSLVVVGILKGAFVFLADLVRRLSVPVEVDFVRLSSYGDKAETSGVIQITKDLELSISGRHVLVVEDIVDTGTTLVWFLDRLKAQAPASLKVCALIDKLERRQVSLTLDYVGLQVEEGFLVGYGLDFSEKYRNLPGIFEVRFTE